jgi:hypothetical protein
MDGIFRISMVREHIECRGMIPKCVNHILNVVLTTITEALVVGEWIWMLSL